ncbi:MAG: SDR family NAD(P)-dependent oxidoreductase [Cyclobacteriaceae bacterium]|nr:SDR family NAD(P)-dependent oxidoreductase [Cyclobacteriaceae bacterium]
MILKDEFALITGASLGIGREMAKELARRQINTLLVALDGPELKETEKFISEHYETRVDSLAADLTDPESAQRIYDWCKSNNYKVSILINNAGFGEGGAFEAIPLERYFKMIDLNNKAYIALIHLFLPEMKKRKHGHIMNTSSMEATLPLPYKAVYTGTKNFIYAYSLALNEEIRRFGVKISILCPGPVLTNEGGLKRIQSQGNKAKLILMMPDVVARVAIRNMLGGMLIINPGKMNWWVTKVAKLIPTRLKMRIMERIFRVYTKA